VLSCLGVVKQYCGDLACGAGMQRCDSAPDTARVWRKRNVCNGNVVAQRCLQEGLGGK
jgi:hypothetical protein